MTVEELAGIGFHSEHRKYEGFNIWNCLMGEIFRLKRENEQLWELLRLAVEDIQELALGMRDSDDMFTQTGCCFACGFDEGNREYHGSECPGYDIGHCFKWQHADKLDEMGIKV